MSWVATTPVLQLTGWNFGSETDTRVFSVQQESAVGRKPCGSRPLGLLPPLLPLPLVSLDALVYEQYGRRHAEHRVLMGYGLRP